jgi:hypothetical protein
MNIPDLERENPRSTVIYNRIMAVFESQALLLEGAEESINLLLGDLDLSSLDPDQRVALQNWHKGIQQASTAIRCPE